MEENNAEQIPQETKVEEIKIKKSNTGLIIVLVLIGIYILKILDSFIPHHQHEAHHTHKHKNDDCHRENGPAIIKYDKNNNIINQKFYLNDKEVDELAILINL